MFQVIITNKVPVTIPKACISISRHIRKGMLIKRTIESQFCTAVGGQQFCKKSRKLKTKIIFEHYYSFFHYCLLFCHYVLLEKSILSKPKWGGDKQS